MSSNDPDRAQSEPVGMAQRLYAIASVVRLEIVEALRLGGVLSTSDLKRRVPDGRGGMQATLRGMAEAGWIRHEGGVGRSSTWSSGDEPVTWSGLDTADDSVRAARGAVEQAARHRRFAYIRDFEDQWRANQWPREWVDAAVSRDCLELLTPEEVTEVGEELRAVVERVRKKAAKRRTTSDGALREEPVFLMVMAFPRRPR